MDLNVIIAGVGGQGTLLAGRVLGEYAKALGLHCKLSELHGMAQRGGSVVTHVRMSQKAVHSPVIPEGDADVVASLELLETRRWLHFLKPGGTAVYSTQRLPPMPVLIGAAEYPEDCQTVITARSNRAFGVDAESLAREAGSTRAANIVVLGVLGAAMELNRKELELAVERSVSPRFTELNRRALTAGFSAYGKEMTK